MPYHGVLLKEYVGEILKSFDKMIGHEHENAVIDESFSNQF